MKNILTRKIDENPFYGKIDLLNLYNAVTTAKGDILPLIKRAYSSISTKEDKELFYILLFSIGDITNRQHNIFGKSNIDNGGNANRTAFIQIMNFIKEADIKQYYKFLDSDLFRQYTCLFNIIGTQIKTKKMSKQIISSINMLEGIDLNHVASYLAKLIKTSTPVEKELIAKWLVTPRISKRQKRNKQGLIVEGGRSLQDATIKLMKQREQLYIVLSEIMNWEIIRHKHNVQFVGLNNWKKQFNQNLESVLFSTKKIVNLDKEQFFKLLDSMPSGARYRTRRRILDGNDKPKGTWTSNIGNEHLGVWFLAWEQFKLNKQKEQRVLEQKIKEGAATEKEKESLTKVKKEAKVNVGASNLKDEIDKWLLTRSKSTDAIIHSMLEKICFRVPVLVIADNSGSMRSRNNLELARLLATVAMIKNPSEDLQNILLTFGSSAKFYSDGAQGVQKANRFMEGDIIKLHKLIDKTDTFTNNYQRLSQLINGDQGSTNFSGTAEAFKRWVDEVNGAERELRKETIQQYPVFIVVTDSDFNNQYNAEASMKDFQMKMLQWFGWQGVVVIWDASNYDNNTIEHISKSNRFVNLENVIYYAGYNIGVINQIFTNIHDLDIIDVFTSLKSLYLSNRYELIKKAIL